jgi:hypothetical protein
MASASGGGVLIPGGFLRSGGRFYFQVERRCIEQCREARSRALSSRSLTLLDVCKTAGSWSSWTFSLQYVFQERMSTLFASGSGGFPCPVAKATVPSRLSELLRSKAACHNGQESAQRSTTAALRGTCSHIPSPLNGVLRSSRFRLVQTS